MRPIYFDYNATTPLDPIVRQAMLPFLDAVFANPSSIHRLGQEVRAMLDTAHERMAKVWKCKPSEVVFTSGGTESNNLAILGLARRHRAKGRHLITTPIEHHAVLHCFQYLSAHEGFEVTYLPVDGNGLVAIEELVKVIRPGTILVSCMAANNETGTIQPVAEIGSFCRERGIIFHTDAVQAIGKMPFSGIHQFNADLVSVCAHKIYGPKGAGALFVKSPLQLHPIIFGGPHEGERRAGTENMAAIAGFTMASELFTNPPVFNAKILSRLTHRLIIFLETLPGVRIQGKRHQGLCNTVAFTTTGCDSTTLLVNLDMEGICASSGSACTAGSPQPSHVLLAMGEDKPTASSLIRFSLGRESTIEDVAAVEKVLPKVIRQSQG